jgi:hypothetical protein
MAEQAKVETLYPILVEMRMQDFYMVAEQAEQALLEMVFHLDRLVQEAQEAQVAVVVAVDGAHQQHHIVQQVKVATVALEQF